MSRHWKVLPAALVLALPLTAGTASAQAGWQQMPHPPKGTVVDVVAHGPSSALAVTEESRDGRTYVRTYHLNAQGWAETGPSGLATRSVTGVSATDSWAFGRLSLPGEQGSRAYRWNGGRWTEHKTGTAGFDIYDSTTASSSDVWVAGLYNPTFDRRKDQAAVGHWDGAKWTVTVLPKIAGKTTVLNAVHAVSSRDVWAAGTVCGTGCQSYVVHWDGTRWTQLPSPATARDAVAYAVTARAGEAWIAGQELDAAGNAEVVAQRWDGRRWVRTALPVREGDGLYMYPTSLVHHGGSLYASVSHTANEGLLRWTGSAWQPVPGPLPKTETVNHLTVTPDGDLVAAGNTADQNFLAVLE